ncbi:MAG: aldo/keto reductase [Lachnospiraceae bacterium]|nr:aldo/keto reductase [Lachnospiraceae bacterium]
MKRIIGLLVSLLIVMVGCNNKTMANKASQVGIKLLIDNAEVEVDWEQNDSVNQLIELTKKGDIVINANRYGGFEQVGAIGHNITESNKQMTTEPGDIVLYNSSNIVVFFGSNAWSYTKLGKIRNKTQSELKQLLDKNKVVFTLKNVANNELTKMNNATFENINEKVVFDLANKRVKLNSGYYMPTNGLGTWSLYDDTAYNSVYNALKAGVRLIDTAQYYANEEEVGRALKRAIEENIVKREDVFITTKVMPSNYQNAKKSIDESLTKLQVEYIDLFLLHQPGSNDESVYKALEEGIKDNKIRSIGISNYYTKDAFDKVMSYATIVPSVIQNENHIYYQNNELRDYVEKYGVVIESYFPFGGRGNTNDSLNNSVIVELSKKYNKTPAQIILRWNLQSNYIAIPGSSNESHIKENNNVYDFTLSDEDMKKIIDINKNQRYANW